MAAIHHGDTLFSRESPVCAYWLSRCDGFSVRKGHRGLGEVQEVAAQDRLGRAEVLRVRTWWRQKLLRADQVAAVVPARKLLIVERRPIVAPRLRRAAAVSRRTGLGAAAGLRAAGGRTAAIASTLVAVLAPLLAAGARDVLAGALRIAVIVGTALRLSDSWLDAGLRRQTPVVAASARRVVTRLRAAAAETMRARGIRR